MSPPQGQQKEKSTSASRALDANQISTRSRCGSSRSQSAEHDLENAPPAFIEKLIKSVETCLFGKINDIVKESESRLMAKFDESVGTLKATIKHHEESLSKLQEKNELLTAQVDDLLRSQRLSDVVIRGIPQTPKENPIQIVRDVANMIGHQTSTYIDALRLGGNSKGHAPIIARFSCHSEQRAFVFAFRKRRGITLSELGGFSSASRVYIGESLTSSNSSFLRESIKLRKLGKLKSARTKNGHVYVTGGEADREVMITSMEQLHQLCEQ